MFYVTTPCSIKTQNFSRKLDPRIWLKNMTCTTLSTLNRIIGNLFIRFQNIWKDWSTVKYLTCPLFKSKIIRNSQKKTPYLGIEMIYNIIDSPKLYEEENQFEFGMDVDTFTQVNTLD